MRHLSLRIAFSKLIKLAQEEFTRCITEELTKGYWLIVTEAEAEDLRRPAGPGIKTGHWLPANFVLKTNGTTRAKLVLDPSGSLNQTLAKAPNLEQNIQFVMCRIQATPIVFSMDICKVFFRILLHKNSSSSNMFLMDHVFDGRNQLTAKPEPNSKLVTVKTLVTVMAILQSPAFLGLC